jgi:hypothetical protein
MLNAAAAVAAADSMFVQIQLSSTTGLPGQRIKLNGSGSTATSGDTIVSWQWTTIPATSDQLIDANQSVATLVVPSFRSIEVVLTITDSGGHTASGTAKIESVFAASSGGGGGFDLTLLSLLVAAVAGKLLLSRVPAAAPRTSHASLN